MAKIKIKVKAKGPVGKPMMAKEKLQMARPKGQMIEIETERPILKEKLGMMSPKGMMPEIEIERPKKK
jgi:hypothetical protein